LELGYFRIKAAFCAAFLSIVVCTLSATSAVAQEQTLLRGKITSPTGVALAGIPVRAHRTGTNITVAVYSNTSGEYAFPLWSDLTPGTYSVAVELPDFEPVKKDAVAIATGKTATQNFTLRSRPVTYENATASEIVAGLPGTDQQKVLFAQCSNCHSLQWALHTKRTKEQWKEVVFRMGGARASSREAPGTYTFNQKQFIEPLAEYLASIRGPNSPDKVPFKPHPRPTADASTNMVVTEYDVPKGGEFDLFNIRGDARFAWPHDVVLDSKYAYYTDHFSFNLGRMDRKTGKIDLLPFTPPEGAGRDSNEAGEERAGNPGGGAHDMAVDKNGNILIGMTKGTIRFDPKTEKFQTWASGSLMFGLDPDGNVWHTEGPDKLVKLDTSSATLKRTFFPITRHQGIYDMDTDSKGRSILSGWRNANIGFFDPKTLEYATYPTPTKMSGPRRGDIDAKDRLWTAQFFAGNIAMFDPATKVVKEYPLAGNKSYTAPYALPYTTSVDDKHGYVWTNDFSSSRIYRFDMKTEKMTEYMMPWNYEVRDITVDKAAPRPTFWLPTYRPPAKLVKVQLR